MAPVSECVCVSVKASGICYNKIQGGGDWQSLELVPSHHPNGRSYARTGVNLTWRTKKKEAEEK